MPSLTGDMLTQGGCAECDRLWRTYAYATRQHVDIIKVRESAAPGGDVGIRMRLEEAIEGAAEWRELARMQVKLHEDAHERKIQHDAIDLPADQTQL